MRAHFLLLLGFVSLSTSCTTHQQELPSLSTKEMSAMLRAHEAMVTRLNARVFMLEQSDAETKKTLAILDNQQQSLHEILRSQNVQLEIIKRRMRSGLFDDLWTDEDLLKEKD